MVLPREDAGDKLEREAGWKGYELCVPVQLSRQTRGAGRGRLQTQRPQGPSLGAQPTVDKKQKQTQMSLFREDRISPCAGWGNSHNSFRHRPQIPQKWPKGQAEVKSPSALAWQHELPFSEHTCNKCGINSSSSVLHTGVSALAGPQKEGRKQLPPRLPVSLGTGKAQWAVTAAATSLL